MEFQLNKANTCMKFRQRDFFLDVNIKVTGCDVHTSIYDKRDDFWFSIVNFPLLSGGVPRIHRIVFKFLSSLDLLGVALAFQISIQKIFKSLPNYWHRVTDIIRLEKKHVSNYSGHTLTFYLNLVKYNFKNMFLKERLTRSFTVFLIIMDACEEYARR